MTGTLERSAPRARPAARRVRPARGARWRVAARLARRQVRRSWLSSLLIAVLVALPIAAMSGYAVFAASMLPTPEEQARVELGRMQAWVAPLGVPDAGFWQSPTQPAFNGYPPDSGGAWTVPDGTVLDDPTPALPSGTETVRLSQGAVSMRTATGIGTLVAWAGAAWDPRFEGRFDLVAGSAPSRGDEILVTEAALARLDAAIGDDVAMADGERTFRIVGVLDAAELRTDESAVFFPASSADLVGGQTRWYLPDLALDWADVQRLNQDGIAAFSRAVLDESPTEGPQSEMWAGMGTWQSVWTTYIVLAIGGVFAAYVVVMLAGAAFAVAARRQQRSLAVAASVGADRRDLFRTIVLQGMTLGLVGGAVGIALGVGAAAAVMGIGADGSATQFWGFHVPWEVLAGILLFSVVVGTLSALVPARTVARTDALQSLRGARRPQVPRGSRPGWGLVLLILGVGLTIVSALVWLAAGTLPRTSEFSPAHVLPPYGIIAGPIIVQIGILISGRWLLWTLSRGLSHTGTAAKIASRDAAANAARTVPAFAAIAATVFIGVFAFSQAAMQAAQTERQWFYDAPLGSLAVNIWPGTGTTTGAVEPDAAIDAAEVSVALAESGGAVSVGTVSRQQNLWWGYPDAASIPADLAFTMAVLPDEFLLDPTVVDSWSSMGQDPTNPLSVIEPDEIETVLGVELSASQLAGYRAGAAVVADDRFVTDGAIEVGTWSGRDVFRGRLPDNVWMPLPDAPERADPAREERIDAIVVDAPLQPTIIAIAPTTAERLGMDVTPDRVIGTLDAPMSTADRDRLTEQAQLLSTRDYTVNVKVESGPGSPASWMVPLLGSVAILVLGASAVALGLARFERRPDDATLAAVGGTRGLRRRIAFWQGLIVAGFGTVAGLAAGVLPPIGFAIQSAGTQRLEDVPWWLLAAFALALPLLVAVVNAVVPPRHPDLTRRTVIT